MARVERYTQLVQLPPETETPRPAVNLTRRYQSETLERETRFELATSTLARSHSTTELLPQVPDLLAGAGRAVKQILCRNQLPRLPEDPLCATSDANRSLALAGSSEKPGGCTQVRGALLVGARRGRILSVFNG